MLNVTNIIPLFFIHNLTHYVCFFTYSYTLCNYSVSTLSRGFFAICSSYFISGFGAGNLKMLFNGRLFQIVLMHILFNLCLF